MIAFVTCRRCGGRQGQSAIERISGDFHTPIPYLDDDVIDDIIRDCHVFERFVLRSIWMFCERQSKDEVNAKPDQEQPDSFCIVFGPGTPTLEQPLLG